MVFAYTLSRLVYDYACPRVCYTLAYIWVRGRLLPRGFVLVLVLLLLSASMRFPGVSPPPLSCLSPPPCPPSLSFGHRSPQRIRTCRPPSSRPWRRRPRRHKPPRLKLSQRQCRALVDLLQCHDIELNPGPPRNHDPPRPANKCAGKTKKGLCNQDVICSNSVYCQRHHSLITSIPDRPDCGVRTANTDSCKWPVLGINGLRKCSIHISPQERQALAESRILVPDANPGSSSGSTAHLDPHHGLRPARLRQAQHPP